MREQHSQQSGPVYAARSLIVLPAGGMAPGRCVRTLHVLRHDVLASPGCSLYKSSNKQGTANNTFTAWQEQS